MAYDAADICCSIFNLLDDYCYESGPGEVPLARWNEMNNEINNILSNSKVKDHVGSYLRRATRISLPITDYGATLLYFQTAMGHYDLCVEKFGYTPIELITNAQPRQHNRINIFINEENGFGTIVIVALISITGLGAFFYIKKRKEN